MLPKINASIESVQVPSVSGAASDCADICIVLASKVRFKVYFWLCIHKSKNTGGVCRPVAPLGEMGGNH